MEGLQFWKRRIGQSAKRSVQSSERLEAVELGWSGRVAVVVVVVGFAVGIRYTVVVAAELENSVAALEADILCIAAEGGIIEARGLRLESIGLLLTEVRVLRMTIVSLAWAAGVGTTKV